MSDAKQPTIHWSRKVLWAAAAYLCLCGLSAIVTPQSWLAVAGLQGELTNEATLAFGVAGTFMLALGCGGIMAALNPKAHLGVIVTMGIANGIDFVTTLLSISHGRIPLLQGILFLVIACGWTIALTLIAVSHPST